MHYVPLSFFLFLLLSLFPTRLGLVVEEEKITGGSIGIDQSEVVRKGGVQYGIKPMRYDHGNASRIQTVPMSDASRKVCPIFSRL